MKQNNAEKFDVKSLFRMAKRVLLRGISIQHEDFSGSIGFIAGTRTDRSKMPSFSHGFSLIEVMILFTVLSVILAASMPIITRKSHPIPQNFAHGVYRCIANGYDANGNPQFLQERYSSSTLMEQETVNQCVFNVPNAAMYKVDLYSAGSGGTKSAAIMSQRAQANATYSIKGELSPAGVLPDDVLTDDILKMAFSGTEVMSSVKTANASRGSRGEVTNLQLPEDFECTALIVNKVDKQAEYDKAKEDLEKASVKLNGYLGDIQAIIDNQESVINGYKEDAQKDYGAYVQNKAKLSVPFLMKELYAIEGTNAYVRPYGPNGYCIDNYLGNNQTVPSNKCRYDVLTQIMLNSDPHEYGYNGSGDLANILDENYNKYFGSIPKIFVKQDVANDKPVGYYYDDPPTYTTDTARNFYNLNFPNSSQEFDNIDTIIDSNGLEVDVWQYYQTQLYGSFQTMITNDVKTSIKDLSDLLYDAALYEGDLQYDMREQQELQDILWSMNHGSYFGTMSEQDVYDEIDWYEKEISRLQGILDDKSKKCYDKVIEIQNLIEGKYKDISAQNKELSKADAIYKQMILVWNNYYGDLFPYYTIDTDGYIDSNKGEYIKEYQYGDIKVGLNPRTQAKKLDYVAANILAGVKEIQKSDFNDTKIKEKYEALKDKYDNVEQLLKDPYETGKILSKDYLLIVKELYEAISLDAIDLSLKEAEEKRLKIELDWYGFDNRIEIFLYNAGLSDRYFVDRDQSGESNTLKLFADYCRVRYPDFYNTSKEFQQKDSNGNVILTNEDCRNIYGSGYGTYPTTTSLNDTDWRCLIQYTRADLETYTSDRGGEGGIGDKYLRIKIPVETNIAMDYSSYLSSTFGGNGYYPIARDSNNNDTRIYNKDRIVAPKYDILALSNLDNAKDVSKVIVNYFNDRNSNSSNLSPDLTRDHTYVVNTNRGNSPAMAYWHFPEGNNSTIIDRVAQGGEGEHVSITESVGSYTAPSRSNKTDNEVLQELKSHAKQYLYRVNETSAMAGANESMGSSDQLSGIEKYDQSRSNVYPIIKYPSLGITYNRYSKSYELGGPGTPGQYSGEVAATIGKQCFFTIPQGGEELDTYTGFNAQQLQNELTTSMRCYDRRNNNAQGVPVEPLNGANNINRVFTKTLAGGQVRASYDEFHDKQIGQLISGENGTQPQWNYTSSWARIFRSRFMTTQNGRYDLVGTYNVGKAGNGTTMIDRCNVPKGEFSIVRHIFQKTNQNPSTAQEVGNPTNILDNQETGDGITNDGVNCYGEENVYTQINPDDQDVVKYFTINDSAARRGGGGAVVITW